ncbi:MAG TPA: NAD(P)-binding domain-containing protein [Candidatus Thermoplasmatota archaeon]|nr:NAD(P)-binding domain-containing protein [Candidatus Thermoplasmatota archaeon]
MKPKVAIIGRGDAGSALARGLARAGYEAASAGREPARVREIALAADVVILAVPFESRFDALREAGDEALAGKVLVDVTNAVAPPDYDLALEPARGSGAEEVQARVPNARVVKTLNTVLAHHMETARAHGERLTAFVAGDDEAAKAVVRDLATDLGFDAVDCGPLVNARWLETMGYFAIQLAYGERLGSDIGIRLVH